MITGLVVDIAVLAATAAFAWAGIQLGGIAATVRSVGVVFAVVVAALLRDTVGDLIHEFTGKGNEFARATAMFGIAMASYGAVEKILQWVQYRLREDQEDWFEQGGWEERLFEPLESNTAGAVSGGLLGFGWALLFVSMLLLTPRDSVFSRASIDSFTGTALIKQEGVLRWMVDGFPHYAQTLPKGDVGAEVGERDRLPLQGEVKPVARTRDADRLLLTLNRARAKEERQTLVWNPELAGVAQRHAEALAAEKRLVRNIPGGGSLDEQAISALGSSVDRFEDEPGVMLIWAHGPANAAEGAMVDEEYSRTLFREGYSEAGIGVADAGWFNGRIYVVLLVAPKVSEDAGADDEDGGADADAAGAGETATEQPAEGGVPSINPFDPNSVPEGSATAPTDELPELDENNAFADEAAAAAAAGAGS